MPCWDSMFTFQTFFAGQHSGRIRFREHSYDKGRGKSYIWSDKSLRSGDNRTECFDTIHITGQAQAWYHRTRKLQSWQWKSTCSYRATWKRGCYRGCFEAFSDDIRRLCLFFSKFGQRVTGSSGCRRGYISTIKNRHSQYRLLVKWIMLLYKCTHHCNGMII